MQIHKKGSDMFAFGSLADKTVSTVHHMLNFVQEFLRNTSQQESTRDSTRDVTRMFLASVVRN